MKELHFTVRLDHEKTNKMPAYYLYRSEEYAGQRPVIDGVYVQRETIGSTPPETIRLVLEWDS